MKKINISPAIKLDEVLNNKYNFSVTKTKVKGCTAEMDIK